MQGTYTVVCSDIEKFSASEAGAWEDARTLSLALCPAPAEVVKTKSREMISFFVDGTEYPVSLYSLTYERAIGEAA